MSEQRNPNLPAFHIFCDNGNQWITSMAAGTTLKDATEYFMGKVFEAKEGMSQKVVDVKQVPDQPYQPDQHLSCFDDADYLHFLP